VKARRAIPALALAWVLALLPLVSCKRGAKLVHGEPAYVIAPQVNLRDRLSAVYEKAGVLKNGERVEILEKSRHFVRVRSARGEEGWIEARYLVGPEIFNAVDELARANTATPVEAHGVARADLKMHLTPGRETDSLYRMDEGARVEILKRATAGKPQAKLLVANKAEGGGQTGTKAGGRLEPSKPGAPEVPSPAAPLEDWWLVRDAQQHVGWVLARMVDIDLPLDVAQYAEGQRIMAAFVLDQATDVDPQSGKVKPVPQYLTVTNEPKDGTPWDYNQIRVFTWNAKRHRYETAYRERDLFGVFPVTVGHEDFAKEGDLPVFTIHVKNEDGSVAARKYKLNQPIVRRVLNPGEQAQIDAEKAQRRAELRQARLARHAAAHPAKRKPSP
jgi:SH3-like domain-containing protein